MRASLNIDELRVSKTRLECSGAGFKQANPGVELSDLFTAGKNGVW